MTVLDIPAEITWIVGQDATAAELNTNLRDAVNYLVNPPLAQLYQATSQTVSSFTSTFTALALDGTNVDTYGGHSNTVNNSRYTAQIPGWYCINATVAFNQNTTGTRTIDIWKNGAYIPNNGSHVQSATTPTSHTWAGQTEGFFYLNVGDYVEIYMWQDSGTSLGTTVAVLTDLCSAMTVLWMHA